MHKWIENGNDLDLMCGDKVVLRVDTALPGPFVLATNYICPVCDKHVHHEPARGVRRGDVRHTLAVGPP
jgi:hypothetical protein